MRKKVLDTFGSVCFCDLCGEIIKIIKDEYSDSNSRISFRLPYNKSLNMNGDEIDLHPQCFNDKIRDILLKQIRHSHGYIIGFEDQQNNIIRKFKPSIFYEGIEVSKVSTHICFGCERILCRGDAEKHSSENGFTKEEFEKLWNSKHVRFYCCSCGKKKEEELNNKKKDKKIILYYCRSDEDIKTISDLVDAGIDYEGIGPISDYNTPLLIYGDDKYTGRKAIQLFISRVKGDYYKSKY